MTVAAIVVGVLALTAPARAEAQAPQPPGGEPTIRVMLLGTAPGPTFDAERLGISTLIEAGSETLLFDAGRGLTTGMVRLAVNPAAVTKVFLTHLHSDHVISLPELLISPWASRGRTAPLEVWGPSGTRSMLHHFQEALAFDIHVRRDIDEKFAAQGIRVIATDRNRQTTWSSSRPVSTS